MYLLIKKYEGWRNNPYLCPANVWTIGYGFTYNPFTNEKITKYTPPLTLKEGEVWLQEMIKPYEKCVLNNVKVPLMQHQLNALVSFVYNVGCQAFKDSTLLKVINKDPNDLEIKNQFLRWNKANGKVLKGLTKRRNEEAYLYFSHLN